MSGRFDLLARDFESSQTQDAHARVERSGPRVPLCSRSQFLFVLGCCLLVLLVSGTLQRKFQSNCRRSVSKSEYHGRLSVAPVAKHNPCLFDGTRGMQTRRTWLCCCFFRQVFRSHLPIRGYLLQFQFRSSSMNLFFRMKHFVAC